jgi:hypothetical protein
MEANSKGLDQHLYKKNRWRFPLQTSVKKKEFVSSFLRHHQGIINSIKIFVAK